MRAAQPSMPAAIAGARNKISAGPFRSGSATDACDIGAYEGSIPVPVTPTTVVPTDTHTPTPVTPTPVTPTTATISVAGTCDLSEAIDNANDGNAIRSDCAPGADINTIIINKNIPPLTSTLSGITSNITIKSGNSNNIIDGNDTLRVFYINGGSLTIDGLIIQNGKADYGGAIQNDFGTLTIKNSTIKNNIATNDGGAIYNKKGTLKIEDSSFINNEATKEGGAIKNYQGTISSIKGSTFQDNEAKVWGGALYNDGTVTNIINSTFASNKAPSATRHNHQLRNTRNT